MILLPSDGIPGIRPAVTRLAIPHPGRGGKGSMDNGARPAEIVTPPDAIPGGLTLATGLFGDLVLPPGAYDPARADDIRRLAAQATVYATQAKGEGTRRAYRSAWR